jgi:glycosyltransferase involved in cell wall biosynthesis
VRELGLTNVEFLGRRPAEDMPALMRVCEAQLVSLRDRPFLAATMPSKVQAVLASGRPAVVSARGDAATLVLQAGAGSACAPEDPVALAEVVRGMVKMPRNQLEAMGQRGLAFYRAELSAARLTERQEALCLQAIARHPSRRAFEAQPRRAAAS